MSLMSSLSSWNPTSTFSCPQRLHSQTPYPVEWIRSPLWAQYGHLGITSRHDSSVLLPSHHTEVVLTHLQGTLPLFPLLLHWAPLSSYSLTFWTPCPKHSASDQGNSTVTLPSHLLGLWYRFGCYDFQGEIKALEKAFADERIVAVFSHLGHY